MEGVAITKPIKMKHTILIVLLPVFCPSQNKYIKIGSYQDERAVENLKKEYQPSQMDGC